MRSRSHGPRQLFSVVSGDISHVCGIGAAVAYCSRPHPVFRHSLWLRLWCPRSPRAGPCSKGTTLEFWRNCSLLIFATCVFLFQLANASMLPLAGEALAYANGGAAPLIIAALIVVPQVIVAAMAPWAGLQAKTLGRRPLLLAGFAALPIRALVFAWTTDPTILIAAQLLDGVSGTMLGVLTALVIADVTAGSGRFNLAQGFVGMMSGLGASFSTTLSGLLAGIFGLAAGFISIAVVGLTALVLLTLLMPETKP